jgi:hypothetical protein
MARKLNETALKAIADVLTERFGDPIGNMDGDGQGVPSSNKKKDMGNRGFGAESCGCGGMMEMDGECCSQCGMMQSDMEESENGGRHPGHAASCTCPDCSRAPVDEKAPPGREKQVKALKKDKNIDNPWAVAWASYNKRR